MNADVEVGAYYKIRRHFSKETCVVYYGICISSNKRFNIGTCTDHIITTHEFLTEKGVCQFIVDDSAGELHSSCEFIKLF
jgi:hypothetical protein